MAPIRQGHSCRQGQGRSVVLPHLPRSALLSAAKVRSEHAAASLSLSAAILTALAFSLSLTLSHSRSRSLCRSKACLCGPCETHGWQNFEDLDTLIKSLTLGATTERGFLSRAHALRDFIKHDYRRMCVNSSGLNPSTPRSAWLCIPFALSTLTDGAFSCACEHEHTMGPSECDEIVHFIDDLSLLLEAKRRSAMVTAAASAAAVTAGVGDAAALAATAAVNADLVAELNERAEELQACARHLDLYVRHMLRKALSHTITPSLLDALKGRPTGMHMIVDYKQKVLPTGHRETQTAAFGKKGKSLHGATCLRWDAMRSDFRVLNVRVVCDDSNQTWFHTLAALRTTLDKMMDTWPDITESTLQSDGAGNYDCTAFMDTVKDTFKAAGVKLTRQVISEVGDGKNLVDQSFQTAQQDMDAARDGGMDLLDAHGILDALETGKALGTINVGMDLGTRALEPKKGPSPLKGIDSLYDREYEYDASGAFTGVRVRQFFQMGAGRLVSKAELRRLWNAEFDASAVKPSLVLPSGGVRTAEDKVKRSQLHNLEHFQAKRAKANKRDQRWLMASFEALAAEAQRVSESTTHQCQFVDRGCRHRSFLTPRWATKHSTCCAFHPDKAVDAEATSTHVRVRVGGPVRLSLTGSGHVGQHSGGHVAASISLISHGAHAVARVTLSTRRPLVGPAYGLQAHRAVHELSTVQAKADAVATRPKDVHARLSVQSVDDGTCRVELALNCCRPPPEMRVRGWAIRPPPSTERYTAEQRSYLAELYAWPEGRLNEEQAFQKFKARFAANDGPYARSLRLDRAQIKAWFSSEKQRQKKAGARAALAAALPDGEGEGGDGAGASAAKQKPPSVARMRAEMETLGYPAEAKASKGAKAVLAALVCARAAPRAAAPAGARTAPAAAPARARRTVVESSSEEEESAAEESEEEDDTWDVEDVLDMRGVEPRREFLIRWAGYPPEANSWEPERNLLPSTLREYLESISQDDEADAEDEEGAEEEHVAAPAGQKRKQPAAPKQPPAAQKQPRTAPKQPPAAPKQPPAAPKQPPAAPKQPRAKRPAAAPAPAAPRPPPRERIVAPPAPKRARDAEPAARPTRAKK